MKDKSKLHKQYVVFSTGKGYSWGKVTHADADGLRGLDEKKLPYTRQDFLIDPKDVVAVLGEKPVVGSVFGCRTEPFFRTLEMDGWGSLHLFTTSVSKEDQGKIKAAMAKELSYLRKNGMTGFLPLDIEIREKKGRWAGTYKMVTAEDRLDILTLHPADWTDTPYILAHECGHGIWYRLMSRKARAKWVEMYHSYLKIEACDAKTVNDLRDRFCAQSEEMVKDFRGQLAEDEASVFDLCIDHIADYHGLSVRNIDSLIEAESGSSLKPMWPTIKVLRTDYEYPISEYAGTKPEEFFAEAFAFFRTGKTLPSRISRLLEQTLQRCAGK